MTSLKNVNFMSQDKFSELVETPNDEIYFVDAENFGMPNRDRWDYTVSSGYIAEAAGTIKINWHSTSTGKNSVVFYINSIYYNLSGSGSGYKNTFETLVSKGDVITWTATTAVVDSVNFFPLKGY